MPILMCPDKNETKDLKSCKEKFSICWENNPSDPNAPHRMFDVSAKRIEEFVFNGGFTVTKEMLEKVINDTIPLSKNTQNDRQATIMCTTFTCPCCEMLLFVEVPYSRDLYRISISPGKDRKESYYLRASTVLLKKEKFSERFYAL